MNEKEKKDLALSKIVLLVLAALSVGVIIWLAWLNPSKSKSDTTNITSFEACKQAGNPVQESYPETCVTQQGKRFTNPDQSLTTLTIEEWAVEARLMNVADVYYSYNKVNDSVIISSKKLDAALERIEGCQSGLHALTYERLKPGDMNDSTSAPWTAAELQAKGAKSGEYYYVEQAVIETLCLPDATNRDVKAATEQVARIRTAMESLTVRN